jgi:hypothetical protein
MKVGILERYTRSPDGRYIIDINAGKVSDLYDDFDRHAPYVRKELDQHLVEYITDSARDLSGEEYTICFHLLEPADASMQERITSSINSYFMYLKNLELNQWARVMRTSLIFLVIGIGILFLSVWVNEKLVSNATVLGKVFAQGLTVAAWVSLWEALANFLINWKPYTQQVKLYDRIAHAPVQFT